MPLHPMRRPLPRAAAALLVAGALAFASAAVADPIAVAAAVRGAVTVTTGKAAPQKVALGRTFERGDKVQVGGGGAVTLFFSDGNVVELAEKSTMTVGGRVDAAGATPKRGVPSEVFARVSRFVTNDKQQSGMLALAPMRSAEDKSESMLLSPRHTGMRSPRPSVRWRPVQGATRYKVTLSGDAGELWNRETDATSLDWPADAAALAEGGEYLCEVQALSDAGPLRGDEASFTVVKADDAKQVDADLEGIAKATSGATTSASLYMAGSYLVGRGLLDEAVTRFQELCKLTPDAPGPHEALGNAYRAMGLPDLAAAELQRALELSR